MQNGTATDAAKGADVERDHLTSSGTVVSDSAFVARLSAAAWTDRLVYNAVIDPHVPFAVGVAYRILKSRAGRDGTAPPPPPEPVRLDRFKPLDDEAELRKQLTTLCAVHPELRRFPRSMIDIAVAQGCAARAEFVKRCAAAKAAGTKLPVLHFRRASDGWTVSTDSFQILRVGDGPAQTSAKVRSSGTSAARNARRRENAEIFRETAWAEEKRRNGWNEDRVAIHLERRATRQSRDRARQEELQDDHEARAAVAMAARVEARVAERAAAKAEGRKPVRLPPDQVRRDSPKATVGQDRMKVDVLGLGRRRVDVGIPVPVGAEVVRVTYHKPGWRGAKVEVRLGMSVPAVAPERDEAAVRARLHAFALTLPEGCTPYGAVMAARAAGVACHGIDFGSAAPHCDDEGAKTRPVRIARADMRRIKAAQTSLSHKDECRRHGGAKPAKGEGRAHVAKPVPEGGATAVRAKGGFRSKRARRQLAVVRSVLDRARNRSATRACQDARLAMSGAPLLVATDPRRMTKPLYAKGGPAGRKARGPVLAEAVTAEAAAAALLPVEAADGKAARRPFRMTPAMERALRRNLHATRFSYRLDRVGSIALSLGTVHCTPGHEGTTSGCPACDRVRTKPLSERVHDCPCGLVLPRDQASAIMTLGRALLSFRDGPDPDGSHALRLEGERKARERRRRRKAGAARARAEKAKAETAGTTPPPPGRGAPGPRAVDGCKRVRGQGRNVRRGA